MNHIVTECPEESVSIDQIQGPDPILGIIFEIALVLLPHLLQVAEIAVIKIDYEESFIMLSKDKVL